MKKVLVLGAMMLTRPTPMLSFRALVSLVIKPPK